MFTPGMTRELVTGFVFTEGFIDKISDIQECTISSIGEEDGEEVIEARVTIPSKASMMTAPGLHIPAAAFAGKTTIMI